MRRATIFALVLIATSSLSLAQDRALISGDAEDNQDTPVPGVRVLLSNDSLRIQRTTTTNSDGLYFFAEVVPAEGYVMSADAPGLAFSPQSVKFEVQVGETRHILPSFIADKVPTTVSRLRRPYSTYRLVGVGGSGLPATRSKPSSPVTPAVLKPRPAKPAALATARTSLG